VRRLPVRLAILALALTAACGPHVPLSLAVQEVPLAILLGLQPQAPQKITIYVQAPPVTLPELLPPGFAPVPTPSPSACPSAPPDADPLVPASPDLLGEPKAGVYPIRVGGTWQPDITKPTAYAFPAAGTMTVTQPKPLLPAGSSDYTYSVVDVPSGGDGEESVETDFLVVPANPTESAPAGQVVTQAAGIFITSIKTTGAHPASFTPSTPITYLNLPVAVGTSWTTAGTDPVSGTTLSLSGSIDPSPQTDGTGRYRVDACGQVYDTWEVHATGTLVGPGENLSLDWYYDVATQFGGLELRHTLAESGQFNGLQDATQGQSRGSQVVDRVTP
jgi:hypothetical protein